MLTVHYLAAAVFLVLTGQRISVAMAFTSPLPSLLHVLTPTTLASSSSCSSALPRHRSSLRLAVLAASSNNNNPTTPRAAASICVQCRLVHTTKHSKDGNSPNDGGAYDYYLLVQRGNEPNKGLWSLPGGKLEFGETALQGAMRELNEETRWESSASSASASSASSAIDYWQALQWYPSTVCTGDAIGEDYHYLIALCFAKCTAENQLPVVQAADDAADAGWWTLSEIQDKIKRKEATVNIDTAILRVEELWRCGLLPTAPSSLGGTISSL